MKKFTKILSLITAVMMFGLCLTSCKYNFSSHFDGAFDSLDEDDFKFEFVSFDVDDYKEVVAGTEKVSGNDNGFILFIGSSENSDCVSKVTTIAEEAYYLNYTGKILFLGTDDILDSLSEHEEVRTTLHAREIDVTDGMVAIYYDMNGNVKWDTSNPTRYDDELGKFTNSGDAISFRAIVDYMVEYCPVTEVK